MLESLRSQNNRTHTLEFDRPPGCGNLDNQILWFLEAQGLDRELDLELEPEPKLEDE